MTGSTPEQASRERPITTGGQLLVEGRVPEMFFRELIGTCGLNSAIEVRIFGDISKDNLRTYLEIFSRKPAFEEKVKRLGIVRDAEKASAASAFQSVQSGLREANLHIPSTMNNMEGTPLAVGIFILPDCQNEGMLETLCLAAATESERNKTNGVLHCVESFFECLEKTNVKPGNPIKARFAGYALARDVIDPQLGRAAQKGCIPWNTSVFDPLKGFLRKIAGQP